MKTILIPPIPELWWSQHRPYHLLLSHLLTNQEYLNFYRMEAALGAHLILDNSAHEFSVGNPIDQLMSQARVLGAAEVVIPDALFDAKRTVNQGINSLGWLMNEGEEYLEDGRQFMVVPQGTTRHEYDWSLAQLLLAYRECRLQDDRFGKLVIGISKDYETFRGGLLSIVENLVTMRRFEDYDFDIHLLGWGRDLVALQQIARYFGNEIRTVDSAKPFVYGRFKVALDGDDNPVYPKRPENYFTEPFPDDRRPIIKHNIGIFEALAEGRPGWTYVGENYNVASNL